jgi:hypothetical protein
MVDWTQIEALRDPLDGSMTKNDSESMGKPDLTNFTQREAAMDTADLRMTMGMSDMRDATRGLAAISTSDVRWSDDGQAACKILDTNGDVDRYSGLANQGECGRR